MIGLYVSFYANVASGASIVLVTVGAFLLSLLIAPRTRRGGASLRALLKE